MGMEKTEDMKEGVKMEFLSMEGVTMETVTMEDVMMEDVQNEVEVAEEKGFQSILSILFSNKDNFYVKLHLLFYLSIYFTIHMHL